MISTISESHIGKIIPTPTLHSLDEIDLDIKCADGSSLPYLGYIEVSVRLSDEGEGSLCVPLLVVPSTDYNKTVPIIVGTNIIRQLKESSTENNIISNEWQSAFRSLSQNKVGVVKTTTKLSLQPMETKTVTGFVRKSADIESAITEPIEQGNLTKVTVCPRVVTLNNPGKTSRVPVKIFNMSAKVVIIPPRANICELH